MFLLLLPRRSHDGGASARVDLSDSSRPLPACPDAESTPPKPLIRSVYSPYFRVTFLSPRFCGTPESTIIKWPTTDEAAVWSFTSVTVVHMTTLNASEEFLEAAAASDAADFWACAAISFLVVSSVVGIIGNTMVCIAIATDRRLQNKTNYALFSLAIADLCVCIFVMPLSMITDSYGAWVVSYELCFAYVYLDVFLCSASIVHMSGIALDRYIALSRPFMKSVKSKKKVAFQLVVVWLTTIFISSPLSIMALLDPSNIYIEESRSCGIMNRGFMLYGSLLSFVIPLIIMSVTNVKTMRILNDKASLSQNSADQFGNGLRRSRPPTRKNGYTRSMSCKGKKPSNFSYTSLSTQNGISRKATCVSAISSDHIELLPHTFVKNSSFDEKDFLKKSPTFRTKVDRFLDRTSSMFTILSSKVSRRSSVHSTSERIANEQKATRVLVVMCVAFSLCWCPFFVANIIYAVCGSSCALPEMAGRLVLWLGYISSTLNPIIYPIFNRRWRVAFKRILLCQCFGPYRADPNHHNYSRNQTFVPAETHTCLRAGECNMWQGVIKVRVFVYQKTKIGLRTGLSTSDQGKALFGHNIILLSKVINIA
ncbi:hypothetical protein L596_014586 [Steinernema carpocapsae]|uniref:G-protein coupled receptors family 1 profile domain-containing protein n=1 Tax=Steinernema carpocapsae TaxID=34508 RepID=A0A4U5NCV9_STECR|nr:hypothetical protein L596_014586 [Steinernema carpocapsae]